MKLVRLIKMCLNETYCRIRVGKNLCDMFPIKNGLKKRYFITIAFQMCFRGYREVGSGKTGCFDIKCAHQRLVYADDVNILLYWQKCIYHKEKHRSFRSCYLREWTRSKC
jgi:hypothetical protein